MILIGIRGQITSESLKGWTVIVQDDKKTTGGFLVILKKANEHYDEWVSNYKDLEKLFDTRKWQVAWEKESRVNQNNTFEKLFSGKVLYNELDLLNESLPLQEQLDVLKEDLLQVESKDGFLLLDIGWYPEFDLTGSFGVCVIKKYDWEKPLHRKKASDMTSLRGVIRECTLLYGF